MLKGIESCRFGDGPKESSTADPVTSLYQLFYIRQRKGIINVKPEVGTANQRPPV